MKKRKISKIKTEQEWLGIFNEYMRGASSHKLMEKHGIKYNTFHSRMSRMRKEQGLELAKKYTLMEFLKVGDRVVVIDGVDVKDNGSEMTVTAIGKIFIEGVDDKRNNIAAYKVKIKEEVFDGTKENLVAIDSIPSIPEPKPQPPAQTEPKSNDDEEIIWERKLIYDVQTTNHLYKVRVEAKEIQIFDGDDNTITINRERLQDVQLILKNLPQILGEA